MFIVLHNILVPRCQADYSNMYYYMHYYCLHHYFIDMLNNAKSILASTMADI